MTREQRRTAINIQIFGKSKCFDTKKAERWFKERRIRFQSIDLGKYGISPGELKSVLNAVGLEALVDPKHPDAALLAYLAYDADKVEKLLDSTVYAISFIAGSPVEKLYTFTVTPPVLRELGRLAGLYCKNALDGHFKSLEIINSLC